MLFLDGNVYQVGSSPQSRLEVRYASHQPVSHPVASFLFYSDGSACGDWSVDPSTCAQRGFEHATVGRTRSIGSDLGSSCNIA
jgi:hypothetical protein